ncbi:hypothetical protein J3R30DRAFT_3458608 [Lentinula aciculospora]|uniref:Aminoglycoside phosphotransferase domain-containing protein n=1 Tax=Lentinula aciculospora TaxID=153920 RepID=A0A9W9DR22_9AGAR|nr:hypothetical protein J3R30DRAFT_3458608 [Lentinula aciculospora]
MSLYKLKSPNRFQDLPGDPGKRFIEEFVASGKKDVLERIASSIRQIRCFLVDRDDISIGKRNVVFFLRFEDGAEWAARLRNPIKQADPAHNRETSRQLETASMESEIATITFIRTQTTIPVPAVLGYDCTFNNDLGCPYMLMDRIEGWPIPDVVELAGGITEAQILKLHAQMAAITWQLALKCTFPVIGQLQAPKSEDNPFPLGQIIDRHARQLGPFFSAKDYYIARSKMIYDEAKRKGLDQTSIDSARLHINASPLTFDSTVDEGPFPLQHPDLHRQNVLIDKDWNIVAIIDWSWCSTVPWQSFQAFPFNLATFITPANQELCKIHERLFWKRFKSLDSEVTGIQGGKVSTDRVFDLFRSRVGRIAKLMNWYAYPIPRDNDAIYLKQLLAISE